MHRAEVIICWAVVVAAAVQFAWRGYRWSVQFEQGGKWDGYAPGLQASRLFGRRVDLSDIQWREFRAGLLPLALSLAAFAALLRLARHPTKPIARRQQLACLCLALCFLGYLHGACTLFVVGLLLVNYALAHAVAGKQYGAALIWAGNLGALLAARLLDGFRFASLAPALAPLDAHRGTVRWEICFNLTILRSLSFGLDLHWQQQCSQQQQARHHQQQHIRHQSQQQPSPTAAAAGISGPPLPGSKGDDARRQGQTVAATDPARWRQRTPLASTADYSATACLAYCLFPPLYLAGPIITFQDFAWQLRQQQRTPAREVLRYAARFVADWLCLEVLTHTLYFNSAAKYRIGLRYREHGLQYGPVEIGMTGFWVLCFMWLKFATIWRFFRLAALVAGVAPPENMRRCFANNYDVEGFWKGWHSSYNQWLVRYLYVPLGGARWRLLNIWPIFLFVAVWHDLEWRLIGWAWLVCLAFVPELLAKQFVRSARFDNWRGSSSFRWMCAAAAALNITGLMAANLAGFVLGLDGLSAFLSELLQDPRFLAATFVVFFCAAQCMFWLRQRRSGSQGS